MKLSNIPSQHNLSDLESSQFENKVALGQNDTALNNRYSVQHGRFVDQGTPDIEHRDERTVRSSYRSQVD